MVKSTSFYVLTVIFIQVSQISSSKNEDKALCERQCLETVYVDCEKKFTTETFYYNSAEMKCSSSHSHCYEKGEGIFESAKHCKDLCDSCHKIFKRYKPNDDCLKLLNVETGNSTVAIKGPFIRWTFALEEGKCTSIDLNGHGSEVKQDFFIEHGLAFTSKEDCDKKCPSVV